MSVTKTVAHFEDSLQRKCAKTTYELNYLNYGPLTQNGKNIGDSYNKISFTFHKCVGQNDKKTHMPAYR